MTGKVGHKACFDLMLRWRDDDVCDASKPAFNCAELGCDGSDFIVIVVVVYYKYSNHHLSKEGKKKNRF